jgi:hypothetical protein
MKCPFCDFEGSVDEVEAHIEEMVRGVMGDAVADLVSEVHERGRVEARRREGVDVV